MMHTSRRDFILSAAATAATGALADGPTAVAPDWNPPGRWRGDDGKTVEGPTTIEVSTPLERLPYFVKES